VLRVEQVPIENLRHKAYLVVSVLKDMHAQLPGHRVEFGMFQVLSEDEALEKTVKQVLLDLFLHSLWLPFDAAEQFLAV
jgi:hypothetical protein